VAVEDWLAALPLLYESFPDLRFGVRHATHADGVALVEATLTDANTGPVHLGDTDGMLLGTDVELLPPTGRVMRLDGVVGLETTASSARNATTGRSSTPSSN